MTGRPAKTFVTLALLAGAALLSRTDARAEPRRGESSTWFRVDSIWSQQDKASNSSDVPWPLREIPAVAANRALQQ